MAFMVENQQQDEDRIIYLSSDISDSSTSDICKQIISYNEVDRKGIARYRQYQIKPIYLYVQSFGGSVYDMWALIDIMESSNTPIITYCTGYCMSAAADIFLAGHYRYMYKHASIMMHQMSTIAYGKITDIKLEQKQMDLLHKRSIKYLKKRTKLPKKFYKRYDVGKEDIYLTAKDCLKWGICDKIVQKTDWRPELIEQMNEIESDLIESGLANDTE
jgi:ATP-dependent Clp protease protease subunit